MSGSGEAGIRVLLVDDHVMVAEAIARMLRTDPRFQMTSIAATAEEAIVYARNEQPDLVLMDIQMPGRSGFDVASQIRARFPSTRVLFLTGHATYAQVQLAVAQKAAGLIVKGCSIAFLLSAVRRVLAGEKVFSDELVPWLEDTSGQNDIGLAGNTVSSLSVRQVEVVRQLASGLTMKEVAANMHLSVKTVESHTYRVMKTLGLHSRVDLAKFAIREGLTTM